MDSSVRQMEMSCSERTWKKHQLSATGKGGVMLAFSIQSLLQSLRYLSTDWRSRCGVGFI